MRSRSGSSWTSRTRRWAPSITTPRGSTSSSTVHAGAVPGCGSAPSTGRAGSTPVSAPARDTDVPVPRVTVPPSSTVLAQTASRGSSASCRRVSTSPPTGPGSSWANSPACSGRDSSSITISSSIPVPSTPTTAMPTARATASKGEGSRDSTRTPGTSSVASRRSDHSRPHSPPSREINAAENTAEGITGLTSALRAIAASTAMPRAYSTVWAASALPASRRAELRSSPSGRTSSSRRPTRRIPRAETRISSPVRPKGARVTVPSIAPVLSVMPPPWPSTRMFRPIRIASRAVAVERVPATWAARAGITARARPVARETPAARIPRATGVVTLCSDVLTLSSLRPLGSSGPAGPSSYGRTRGAASHAAAARGASRPPGPPVPWGGDA